MAAESKPSAKVSKAGSGRPKKLIAASLCLVAFVLASWWSWQDAPQSDPFEPAAERTLWQRMLSPIERNAFLRPPVISNYLNGVHAVEGTDQVWAVGGSGAILHSTNGGKTWDLQENIDWTPANRPPEQKAAASIEPIQFIRSANAAEPAAPMPPDRIEEIQRIAEIQRLLAALGYDPGSIDGAVGPATLEAVRRFQVDHELPADAMLTDDPLQQLAQVVADRAAPTARQTQAPGQPRVEPPAEVGSGISGDFGGLKSEFRFLTAIAFADTKRGVAVGMFGVILSTFDGGISWSAVMSGTDANLSSITYADGLWVAVGVGGTILTSPDAATWTEQRSGVDTSLQAITHAGVRWVAVGNTGTILTSEDARTWTAQRSGTRNGLRSIAHANDRWVAVGALGAILTSADASNWTVQRESTDSSLLSIAHADGRWVAVGEGGTILTSSDANTWTEQRSGTDTPLHSITHADGRWVALGGIGILLTSEDASTWVGHRLGMDSVQSITYGDGRWVAVGTFGTIRTSTDSSTWTLQRSGTLRRLMSIVYADGRWVAVGEDGTILTSADASTWTLQRSGTSTTLLSVAHADGRWVAVGDVGTIVISTDASTWTLQDGSTSTTLLSVAHADGRWVAVGTLDTILTSPDTSTWTMQDSGMEPFNLLSIAHADGHWVLVNGDGGIWTSSDATSWTIQRTGTEVDLQSVAHADGRWVAVGGGGTILTSADSSSWTVQGSGTEAWLESVAHADGRWVAAGAWGTILSSTDKGETWAPVTYARYPAPWVYTWLVLAFGFLSVPKPGDSTEIKDVRDSVAGLLVSDGPLRPGDPDYLGFTTRAEQLSKFLRNENTQLPVTLAITAEWGRGKSSLMRLLADDLGRHGFRPVWFNAWHHENEGNLLASLLRQIGRQALPAWWHPRGLWQRSRLLLKRRGAYRIWALTLFLLSFMTAGYFLHFPDRWSAIGPNLKYRLNIERPTVFTLQAVGRLAGAGSENEGEEARVPYHWIKVLDRIAETGHRFNSEDELVEALKRQAAKDSPLTDEIKRAVLNASEHISPPRVMPELQNIWAGASAALAALAAFLAAITVLLNGMTVFGWRMPRVPGGDEQEPAGTRERFQADFQRLTEVLGKTLVILVDDLDRCTRRNLLHMFEHINFLASVGGCTIVMAVAYERVMRHLAVSLAEDAGQKCKDDGPTEEQKADADFYLQKLVQLEVAIPRMQSIQTQDWLAAKPESTPKSRSKVLYAALGGLLHFAPWALLLALAGGGTWFGANWVSGLYPDSDASLRKLDRALADLDRPDNPATTPQATGTSQEPDVSARPAKVSGGGTFVPDTPAGFPWWLTGTLSGVGLLLLGGVALWQSPGLREKAGRRFRLVLAMPERSVDSDAFREALGIWHEVIAARATSPRALKRFLNRLRFTAMNVLPANEENSEAQIVALAAELTSGVRATAMRKSPGEHYQVRIGEGCPSDEIDRVLQAWRAHRKKFGGPSDDERQKFSDFVRDTNRRGEAPDPETKWRTENYSFSDTNA